ncbi:MAG: tetratricopeptide repeat protein [Treponema sp.]|jgi:tetratricopeptide (TPR) repeat protein|nr:tetratricopeptide repeat protein [Treponema sp.]
MTRIVLFLVSLTAFLPWTSCGGESKAIREYGEIRDGELRGEALIAALEDFEVRYPGHFDSKVDLGIYYLARGEEGRARDYLRRAEIIAERTPGAGAGEKSRAGNSDPLPVMYGALGQIYLNQQDYRRALDYAEKAIGYAGDDAGIYRSLKAHILIAQQEYAGALEIFDGLFAAGEPGEPDGLGKQGETGGFAAVDRADRAGWADPAGGTDGADWADPAGDDSRTEDILAYLFLLAQAERSADAVLILNRYFETGAFFPNLGTFAAMVYRTAGETERAAYAVYLEQEYRSGYGEGEPENRNAAGIPAPGGNFFAGEYLALKDQIRRGSLSEEQFIRYIELESYFRLFPSYYWNLWLGARLVYPETYANFALALQKIIALDREGPFAREAWKELTFLFGY